MIGEIIKDDKFISAYQPNQDVVDLTARVKKDYQIGDDILHNVYVELNNRSVLDDQDGGHLMFNAFVDIDYNETEEQVKEWKGTRSTARNKALTVVAQMTGTYLLPLYEAQNSDDEVDKDMSEVMRDGIEWMTQPTVSNYQEQFLQVVFGMMTNPVTYLSAEFCEVYQDIKKKIGKGIETKKVLDEVLSGFQVGLWGAGEVLITNAFERNIQKQRAIIQRRYKDYTELEAKYGEHKNWKYVNLNTKSVYNEENGLFYDVKDENNPTGCIEEIWKCRREDLEVPFVNGVYVGDDNVNHNPIKHRDNFGNPKYNITPFGYYRIGTNFFYFKSLMNALRWDNMLIDAVYEVGMNNELLYSKPPIGFSGVGDGQIDTQVISAGGVISFESDTAKAIPLLPPKNNTLLQTIPLIEQSMEEGSISKTISGQLPEASQKAYSVAQAQANAKTILKGQAKALSHSIIQFGDLMKDVFLNQYTIAQIDQITGDNAKLKYRQFFLEEKKSAGKLTDKTMKLDSSLIGKKMTKKEMEMEEYKMLEEVGYPQKKKSLVRINPEMIAKFKYLVKVNLEEMFTKNQEYWQPILMGLKSQLINDPYTNQEALTRKLHYSFFRSEGDELVNENPQIEGEPKKSGVGNQIENAIQSKGVGQMMNTPQI